MIVITAYTTGIFIILLSPSDRLTVSGKEKKKFKIELYNSSTAWCFWNCFSFYCIIFFYKYSSWRDCCYFYFDCCFACRKRIVFDFRRRWFVSFFEYFYTIFLFFKINTILFLFSKGVSRLSHLMGAACGAMFSLHRDKLQLFERNNRRLLP